MWHGLSCSFLVQLCLGERFTSDFLDVLEPPRNLQGVSHECDFPPRSSPKLLPWHDLKVGEWVEGPFKDGVENGQEVREMALKDQLKGAEWESGLILKKSAEDGAVDINFQETDWYEAEVLTVPSEGHALRQFPWRYVGIQEGQQIQVLTATGWERATVRHYDEKKDNIDIEFEDEEYRRSVQPCVKFMKASASLPLVVGDSTDESEVPEEAEQEGEDIPHHDVEQASEKLKRAEKVVEEAKSREMEMKKQLLVEDDQKRKAEAALSQATEVFFEEKYREEKALEAARAAEREEPGAGWGDEQNAQQETARRAAAEDEKFKAAEKRLALATAQLYHAEQTEIETLKHRLDEQELAAEKRRTDMRAAEPHDKSVQELREAQKRNRMVVEQVRQAEAKRDAKEKVARRARKEEKELQERRDNARSQLLEAQAGEVDAARKQAEAVEKVDRAQAQLRIAEDRWKLSHEKLSEANIDEDSADAAVTAATSAASKAKLVLHDAEAVAKNAKLKPGESAPEEEEEEEDHEDGESGFDCTADIDGLQAEWSDRKRMWCCEHQEVACEESKPRHQQHLQQETPKEPNVNGEDEDEVHFDCAAGINQWKAGWSDRKKRWCCLHQEVACEEDGKPHRENLQFSEAES
mmetsp:Transcript_35600/g.64540  ORF Transcript_35600/g.64540 Transcript_35600/m.64540 type:complete len:637 (+) Transcript_35600:82-1992(+)